MTSLTRAGWAKFCTEERQPRNAQCEGVTGATRTVVAVGGRSAKPAARSPGTRPARGVSPPSAPALHPPGGQSLRPPRVLPVRGGSFPGGGSGAREVRAERPAGLLPPAEPAGPLPALPGAEARKTAKVAAMTSVLILLQNGKLENRNPAVH